MARLSDTERLIWELREQIRQRDEALGRVRKLADYFTDNLALRESILAAIRGELPEKAETPRHTKLGVVGVEKAENWKVYKCCKQQVPDGHLPNCKGARND